MNQRKGISMITLLITIVVLIILSTGTILMINNAGVVGESKETKFKADLKSFDEEIRTNIGSEYIHNNSIMKKVIVKKSEIEKYSKGLIDSEYIKYAYISDGVLTLRGNKITSKQRKWAEEAKIKIDDGDEIIVSDSEIITNLSHTEWTNEDVTLTIVGLKDKSVVLHEKPYSFDNGITWEKENAKIYEENTLGIFVRVRDEYEYIYTNPEIQIKNIDKIAPSIPSEIIITQGLNTLIVAANGSVDEDSGIAGYKYSIDNIDWTEVIPQNETYIFDKLQPNTSYTVYAKAVDVATNESLGSKTQPTNTLVPNSTITIELSDEEWTKGPISASIYCDNIPLNYVLQYKLSEDQNYTNGNIIPEIKKNTIIEARLYYEEIDSQIANAQKEVDNIDDVAPKKPSGISVTPGINTLEVKAYGSEDNESGLAGYKYSLDPNADWSKIGIKTENETYLFDGITSNTAKTVYARAVDNVGNMSTEIFDLNTSTTAISGKVAITLQYISGINTYTDSSGKKWTKKVNVKIQHSSIPTGYELVYKVNSGSPTTFTKITNVSTIALDYNCTVTATLYNSTLKEEVSNTLNNLAIGVIDNIAPTKPTAISTGTKTINSFVVKATGSTDAGCGLAGYQYSIDNKTWSSTIASGSNHTITGLKPGTSYTVYAKAIDNLGNETTGSNVYNQSIITLYQYAIAYNKNTTDTVTNMPANQTKTENTTLKLNDNVPARTGYKFNGWSTSANAAVAYAAGANYTANAAATLYANWTPITYTVVYNSNGGSGTMKNVTHTYNEAKTLTTNTFTYTGYIFDGWSTSADGNVEYTDGESVINLRSISGTINLYAQWKPSHIHTSSCYHSHTTECYSQGNHNANCTYTERPCGGGYSYTTTLSGRYCINGCPIYDAVGQCGAGHSMSGSECACGRVFFAKTCAVPIRTYTCGGHSYLNCDISTTTPLCGYP